MTSPAARTLAPRRVLILLLALAWCAPAAEPARAEPDRVGPASRIPERLVVLTFDDSVRSHFTVVRPILKKYGFNATFFITEGFDFKTNKRHYMTWEQIAQLSRDGFEIGNHTADHLGISDANVPKLDHQLTVIEQQCRKHGIPEPVTFAWPGNVISIKAFPIFKEHGIRFARRGGGPEYPYEAGRGFAYQPGLDHPYLVPSAGDARPDWELEDFVRAVEQARFGRIAALQFHGVPDEGHPWVNTPRDRFEQFMHYLAQNDYQVIAMRDLARYVDATVEPKNPFEVIEDRKQGLEAGIQAGAPERLNYRRPENEAELRRWLVNMAVYHRYDPVEIGAATGLTQDEVEAALARFEMPSDPDAPPPTALPGGVPAPQTDQLFVLPYPGGRHPRIGFLDGAMRPQRDTKFSVFPPWSEPGKEPRPNYVVADIPEAIWMGEGQQRQLLYLAHTHVPTVWSKQGVQLEPLEWTVLPEGRGLRMERRLPNGVTFGTQVEPRDERSLTMRMWLENPTDDTLTGLIVQNCLMLKQLEGFSAMTADNKRFDSPFALCHNAAEDRWLITAWRPCHRPWGNAPCPCLHSDPKFPDCPPGETVTLEGWLSFHEGRDIEAELQRIRQVWQAE